MTSMLDTKFDGKNQAPVSSAVGDETMATTSAPSIPPYLQPNQHGGQSLSPFYLSPFVLAAVTWLVATRKHPEDKEKWSHLALGFSLGAVVMFLFVLLSDPTKVRERYDGPVQPSGVSTFARLPGIEVLPPTRIRQRQSVAVGSLQITLYNLDHFGGNLQLDSPYGIDPFETTKGSGGSPPTYTRYPLKIRIGGHAAFGLNGHYYQLGLLEIHRPLRGLAPDWWYGEFLVGTAVIHLRDLGPISSRPGEPSTESNTGGHGGLTGGPPRGASPP